MKALRPIGIVVLFACATASQQAADEAELREQETKAPLMHYPLRAEGVPALDSLGGRYRLMRIDGKELCFEAVFQSENGNENAIQFYMSSVDDSGKQTLVHQDSALLLGVKTGMLSTDNDLQSGTGAPVNASAQGIGSNVAVSNGAPSGMGSSKGDTTSGNETRMVAHAYMNVCFPKPPDDKKIDYLTIQRGDIGLMNPHPLRAVWKLVAAP